MAGLRKRSNDIVAVAVDMFHNFSSDSTDDDVIQMVEDCTGYKLSDREKKLAVQAYDCGSEFAKRGAYYT